MLFLCGLAFAEEPVFVGTKEGEEVAAPKTSLVAELGGAFTTGNVDFYVLSGSINGDRRWEQNAVTVKSGGLIGRSRLDVDGDGLLSDSERETARVESARRAFTDLRYDRFLGEKNSLYVLGGVLTDIYAGYDWRSHEQVGYSRRLIKSDAAELFGEFGLDYAQENYVDDIDPNTANVLAGRGMLGLSVKLTEDVKLHETIEVYENLLNRKDARVLNTASLTVRVGDKMSFKLSHILVFDNGRSRGWSRVVEVDPETKKIVWQYRAKDFFSRLRGGAQRLPNGNTLVTESVKGRVFEVTPDGEIVWDFSNPEVTKDGKRRQIYRMFRLPEKSVAAFLESGPDSRAHETTSGGS